MSDNSPEHQFKAAQMTELFSVPDDNNTYKFEWDISIPTPVEVAQELEMSFTREQAESIAMHVY